MVKRTASKLQQGFTLLELLIATTLLASLLLVCSYAFSLFSSNWEGRLGKFWSYAVIARDTDLVRRAVQQTQPYVVRNPSGLPTYYFEGNEDSCVGVTGSSLFKPQHSAVYRLRVEQAQDLTYRVIYEESIMVNWLLTTSDQDFGFERQLVLLEGVGDIEFGYWGYRSLDEINQPVANRSWSSTFNAVAREIMPAAVQISYVKSDQFNQIRFALSESGGGLLAAFREL